MKYKFLGQDIELSEFNISQSDEIQGLLLGNSNITGGEASVSITDFKASQYLAIEYGTKSDDINRDYILGLPAKKAADVQTLYDAIMEFNGQSN